MTPRRARARAMALRAMALLATALASTLLAGPARAQPAAPPLDAQVTFVAGANAYLDAGTADGLAAGDTLSAARGATPLGALVVVSATADRAVVTFAGPPFPLTRGDRLTLTLPVRSGREAPPVAEAPPADTAAAPERPSLLDRPAAPTADRPPARAMRLDGRLLVGVDGLTSRTDVGPDVPAVERAFATPFAALRLTADGLPGGLRLAVNGRAAYRYASATPFAEPADLRLYELSLERAFTRVPVQLRAGRFSTEHDRFTGPWDGLLVHVGGRGLGAGVAAGFQPDRGAALPTAEWPKLVAFAHAAADLAPLRWTGTALAGQVRPREGGLAPRSFVGTTQALTARGVALTADALADQDPATDAWALSRLSARASVQPAPGVRLHAQALRRRTYLLFGGTQALLAPSTRVGGGASLTLRGGPLPGLTLRADAARAWAEGAAPTLSAGGGLALGRLPGLPRGVPLGLAADAAAWAQPDAPGGPRRGLAGGAALTLSPGGALAQLGYRYSATPLFAETLVGHGLDALVQLPLTRRLALTVQATASIGDRLASTRLYSALWWRL